MRAWPLLLALLAGGSAVAQVPGGAREAQLVRMVRQDCGSCHGMTLAGGLGPALTREALETVRITSPQAVQGISFEVEVMPTLVVDPVLMRQVLINLIGNAVKFCREVPAPAVKVSAQQEGQRVVVQVRDNGVGFDVEHTNGLFQPFVRLHGPSYEGTGIGLATVKRIVEMHGGQIWAESAPGLGATFRFSLPVLAGPFTAQG